ncbi:hypothetical protein KIN20_017992 [Parelaphostrongylus tenuis]|uniref:Uncharacterized protein n=1 Tax=Parelaphostrongylus tenuis TaxID=148309 RepID=A0AAD5N3S1_PARTN|nr:hypothetical protein KIN20_017992 [Parelaphostrongylus tenuis]
MIYVKRGRLPRHLADPHPVPLRKKQLEEPRRLRKRRYYLRHEKRDGLLRRTS